MKWIKLLFLLLKTIVLLAMIVYASHVIEIPINISTIELINKLDGNEITNFHARWALEDRGKPVVQSLIYAFKYKNERIRERIPSILAHINGRESFPFLIEALKDKNYKVVANAQSAIADLALTHFDFLEYLLSCNDPGIEDALIHIPANRVISLIENHAHEKNLEEKEIIQRFTGHLIRLLNHKHGTQTRIQAIRILVELTYPNSASYIIPFLEDKELFIRINAIRTLSDLKSVQAVPFIIRHLKDSHFQIRMECAAALGFMEAKDAVLPLIDLFQDKDWRVTFRAIISLGLIKDERFIAPSIHLFKTTKNQFIKRIILYSLKKIVSEKHTYLIPFLVDAYWKSEYEILRYVITTLEKIGKPSQKSLISILNNRDEYIKHSYVFKSILKALESIGDQSIIDPILEFIRFCKTFPNHDELAFALDALSKFNDQQLTGVFIDSLKDKDSTVRMAALEALKKQVDPRSLPAIKKVIESESPGMVGELAHRVLNSIKNELNRRKALNKSIEKKKSKR